MAQKIICLPLTAEAQVQSQASPCGILMDMASGQV